MLSIGQMASSIGTGRPPLSDEVKALLDSATPKEDTSRPEVLVNVPQAILQVLAERVCLKSCHLSFFQSSRLTLRSSPSTSVA